MASLAKCGCCATSPFAFDADAFREAMRLTAEPGDAVYLPLGWLHDARTVGECSVHVTVGVTPPRWLDVIQATILEIAAGSSLLRSELPSAMNSDQRVYFAEDARHVGAVLAYLSTKNCWQRCQRPSQVRSVKFAASFTCPTRRSWSNYIAVTDPPETADSRRSCSRSTWAALATGTHPPPCGTARWRDPLD